MLSLSLSHKYTPFMNRQLLHIGSTKGVSEIYLSKFKPLGTTGLAF